MDIVATTAAIVAVTMAAPVTVMDALVTDTDMDVPVMVAVIVERLRFEADSPVVVDSTATWAAEASMAVAVVEASMAVAAVASTVVADTGKTAGLIQRKAAAGFQSRGRFCFASIKTDRYPRRLSACLVAS
jgi:hypothetical protein